MNAITIKDLNKSFVNGRETANILKNINLNVEKGEFVSIMGPSGCGKSTLLYLLGGLDKPTSGSVSLYGTDLSTMKEKDLCDMRSDKIGFVFQFYNLVPNLNVEDNIALPLMIAGKKRSSYKKKIDEVLEIIGMTDKRKLTPRELSGGQQQRVAIARALVFDPEILFLDEPIGNLDSKTGMRIMELFREINKRLGMTIVQVTHSEEAARYGTKLVRVLDGRIESVEDLTKEKSGMDRRVS
ncbi:MAG: ABC transporter ATP-binding protein [Lachnospiraceae bacterium]|nr:ABC transporter ATP-binding protein [Lachnospiraceae bacterium]MBR6999805.1 ABC transporter ATP-binding protein [Lachnospiraceae bacterium]